MKLKLSDAVLGRVLNQALAGHMSIRDQERAIPVFRKALEITMVLMEARKAKREKLLQGE
jgi:hypothetical protein